jgi:hypothetical protein
MASDWINIKKTNQDAFSRNKQRYERDTKEGR